MLRSSCPDPRVGSGKLWDDLGSTQFVTSKSGPVETNAKRNALRGRIIGSSEEDDDELDFLSSGSRSEEFEETSPSKGKRKVTKGRLRKAIVQGQELDYHPGYPPKKKFPDFKKLSKEGGVSTSRSKLSDVSQEVPKQTKSHGILPTISRLSGTSSDEGGFVDGAHSLNLVHPGREIQLSDSSDCSQATPRAKYSKRRIPEKFPTLDPLSISDATAYKQASPKAVAKRKVRLKCSSDRVTSPIHSETVSDRTTPRKHSESSIFPFPSPLSSSPQHPQSSLSTIRGTKSLSSSDDEDADNRTPKQRPPLRPFPMMAATWLKNSTHSPRLRISSAQQTHPDDGGNTIAGDLEEFGDDSCQRLQTNMLIALILTIFFSSFYWRISGSIDAMPFLR
jgi:hypothetical protein